MYVHTYMYVNVCHMYLVYNKYIMLDDKSFHIYTKFLTYSYLCLCMLQVHNIFVSKYCFVAIVYVFTVMKIHSGFPSCSY